MKTFAKSLALITILTLLSSCATVPCKFVQFQKPERPQKVDVILHKINDSLVTPDDLMIDLKTSIQTFKYISDLETCPCYKGN